jgi:hypothetical protein
MIITTEKLCKVLSPDLFITSIPGEMQEYNVEEEVTDECCQTICQYEDSDQKPLFTPGASLSQSPPPPPPLLHQLKKPELIDFIFKKCEGKVTRSALRKKKKEVLFQDAQKL